MDGLAKGLPNWLTKFASSKTAPDDKATGGQCYYDEDKPPLSKSCDDQGLATGTVSGQR